MVKLYLKEFDFVTPLVDLADVLTILDIEFRAELVNY
jgi:hypothetical protein